MNSANSETLAPSSSAFLSRYDRPMKWLSLVLIVLSLCLFARSLPLDRLIEALKAWIDRLGAAGLFAFGLLYVVATVAFLPASLLTIAAGAMFGLVKGTVIVSLSSTTGAALAFLIARYFARQQVASKIQQYPQYEAVDKAIGKEGWKIVALLRLSPAMPFNLQNYLYGLTSIRFWPCVLTSWIAMLPGTFMYVYIGYLGRTGLQAAAGADRSVSVGQWILRIVGSAATIAVTVYITFLARRTLKASASLEDGWSGEPAMIGDREKSSRTLDSKPWHSLLTLGIASVLTAAAIWTYIHQDMVQTFVEHRLQSQPDNELSENHAR